MDENKQTTGGNEPRYRWMWPRHNAGHWVLWLIGLVVLALVAGAILLHLAFGRYGFGDSRFMGPEKMIHTRQGEFGFRNDDHMMGALGSYGNSYTATVKSVSGTQITVTAANGVEQTLQVTPSTVITRSGNSIKLTDLKTGDSVSVWSVQSQSGPVATNIQAQ